MAHGIPPREMPSPHNNQEEETHSAQLHTAWTHPGTCWDCQLPGDHHDQRFSVEHPHWKHHLQGESEPGIPQKKRPDQLPSDQDSSISDPRANPAGICSDSVGPTYPSQHQENRNGTKKGRQKTLHRYHNTSSVTAMLDHLQWTPLEHRKQQQRLAMYYKIHHEQVAINRDKYTSPANRTTRHSHKLAYQVPDSTKDYLKNAFVCQTTREWNLLPVHIVEAPSLESFRNRLDQGAPYGKSS